MRTRHKLFVTSVLLASVGGSAYAFYSLRNGDAPPAIVTAQVSIGEIVDTVGATGMLQAVTTVQVGSQVSGTISALYADYNSIVRKGQLLATLDSSLFETQIEQAQANLIRAESDVERLRVALEDAGRKQARTGELWAKMLVPETEVEAAEVAVRAAQAQLRSADAQVAQARASLGQQEVNLAHTRIESPIDGIVLARSVDVGQTVAASTQAPTLFILAADLSQMQVVASLDESDIGSIRPDQRVRFTVDAYPGEWFDATVVQVRLQPQTVQNVVTYDTVIDVRNASFKLKPGMTASVTIEVDRRDDVVRVPNAALRFRPTADTFAALGQVMPETVQGSGASRVNRAGGVGFAGVVPDVDDEENEVGVRSFGADAATTVDALFGPLPVVVSPGRVWVMTDGRLASVSLQLGLSDGQLTEVMAGDLASGAEVVTGVAIAGAQVRASAVTSGQSVFSAMQPSARGRSF